MNLRKIALITVVLLASLSLFATEVSVTWEWDKNDADVTYFRYQLDGESSDGWTVVPADVTSYTAEGLDGSIAYNLYLQQSYDGQYWSVSAVSTSEPVVPVKAEFVDAVEVEETPVEVAVVEEEPVAVVEEPVAVIEEPAVEEIVAVVEEPAPEKKPSTFQFTTDLSVGAGYGGANVKNSLTAALGLDFENLVTAGPVGFDVRTDWGFNVYNALPFRQYIKEPSVILDADSYNWAVHADLQLGLNLHTEKFMIYADGGVRLVGNLLGYDSEKAFYSFSDKLSLKWGVTADLGMRYNLGKVFGIGAEASYTYLFDGQKRHMFDTRAFMSLTF